MGFLHGYGINIALTTFYSEQMGQVLADRGCPDKRHETLFTFPGRFAGTKGSFQFRNIAFNTGTKVSQHPSMFSLSYPCH